MPYVFPHVRKHIIFCGKKATENLKKFRAHTMVSIVK